MFEFKDFGTFWRNSGEDTYEIREMFFSAEKSGKQKA